MDARLVNCAVVCFLAGEAVAPQRPQDPNFPAMKGFPARLTITDEIYQHKNLSRQKVHVLRLTCHMSAMGCYAAK